jgi:alkanesulfonate monooxygenase SsuD/methylene tetrahydromethanopterin reductase-like flavin-dependent oxidoreductase (luciferase family)
MWMKIGIGLPNQVRDVRPSIIPLWATQAERAGFSSLSSVGRIAYPGVMDTVALAAAAGATSEIGLLTGVLLGPVWPPALLAKELAGIDGVSGGRLTVGIGIGSRPDDFVTEGRPARGLGKRIDRDLDTYREVWQGKPVGGGTNPGVPSGTRQVPLLFGGISAPAAFARMARWGQGFIGASLPPEFVAQGFEAARNAWKEAGREGSPRLVAIAYFALGDADRGRSAVADYYSLGGKETVDSIVSAMRTSPAAVQEAVTAFRDLGADELILNPTLDDPDEISRLADLVLG